MTDQSKDLIFQTPLGDVIKAWRTVRELTVTELAARAGEPISKGYISEVENNKIRKPNDEYLIRIAKALDIPVEYLVMRRLPDEQLEASDKEEKESAFIFDSPIRPRLDDDTLNEEEELQQILVQLGDLQSRVRRLIKQKGRR